VTRLALEIGWGKALLLQHPTAQAVTRSVAQLVVALDGVQPRHRGDERRIVHHRTAVCPHARGDRGAKNAMPHYQPDLHGARTLGRMLTPVKQT
jgi:hypothetical protein